MTLLARLRDGKVVATDGLVHLREQGDPTACKCCASECEAEVTVEVTFCGYTVTLQVPIPGSAFVNQDLDESGPGESYINVEAVITCGPCGWNLQVSVCAYCEDTGVYASDGFTAVIPFAGSEETPGGGHCPESGEVELECFGLQFGIPCVTTTTATIA